QVRPPTPADRDARADANWDAGWTPDADASFDPDADLGEPDAGEPVPPWDPALPDAQGPVSFSIDCPTPPPTPPVSDSCRALPWHTPACYRTPVECQAVHESSYCLSIQAGGAPMFTGLDQGSRCVADFLPDYGLTADDHRLAQLGGDIITTDQGLLVRHSLADGSFDVAPRMAFAVFVLGTQLVLVTPEGALVAYANWADVVNDRNPQTLANVSPPTGAVFGSNSKTIVAAWPSGRIDLFTPGVSARILRVQGYQPQRDGEFIAADLSEDGSRIFLLTYVGIWTVDAMTGKTLRRLEAPNLQGLSCSAGIMPGASVPPIAGDPRPGYHYETDRAATAILSTDQCPGPYNGPRYYGQTSGPELLVISTFFDNENEVTDERASPHVLVLTSVSGSRWTVRVAPGAMLERILVSGPSAGQLTLDSPYPVPVEYHDDSIGGSGSLGGAEGSWPSLDQAELQRNVEQYTKRPLTELLGCHFGTKYTVRNVPPLCAL
ncbi:MAG TPA: hypothetical protein VFZ61_02200, partial [Polyangiales bacterium]